MKTFLVTATPPTPNGDLHVGHLSGPFLAADVFSRYQRMRGEKVVFATGSDDHQSYVHATAAREGKDPVAVADDFTERIQVTLRTADIEVDHFGRALGNACHRKLVRRLFRALVDSGCVTRKRHPALYCRFCERLLFEGFVRGWCPRCGEETPGHLCEMCGWVNDPIDLVEPTCNLCRGVPGTVEREGLYLPLEPHRGRLEDFWSTRATWRPHLMAFCEAMLAKPLPEYPVSHPGRWGIQVPSEGVGQQVVNVWLEMYAGHIVAGRATEVLEDPPTLDAPTIVQFLGHDNSFYNAVLHAAVSLALDESWPTPEHLITNEFYFLEDRKFSTSRNHAISGQDALAMVGSDCLRFHLARSNPERWQTNFSRDALIETEQREIQGIWTAAIRELQDQVRQVPSEQEPPACDLRVAGLIQGATSDLERCYGLGGFSLRQASSILLELAAAAVDFSRRASNAKPGPVPRPTAGDAAALLRSLALLSAPLVPSLSQEIWRSLGAKDEVTKKPWPRLT